MALLGIATIRGLNMRADCHRPGLSASAVFFATWSGEVTFSCNLSYWEARIGDGYEQLILNQPWETWHCGRIILSYQLDIGTPRNLAFQDPGSPGL
jgi:hypothetical protein